MAEMMTPPPEFFETLRKFDANARWAIEHQGEILPHEGRYVAIDDRRLLDVSDDGEELREKYADRPALYVTFVYPPGMAWLF